MYEIINFAGSLSIVLGITLFLCAFIIPGGAGSSKGYMFMAAGLIVIMCGVLPKNDGSGRTISQYAIAWLVYRE